MQKKSTLLIFIGIILLAGFIFVIPNINFLEKYVMYYFNQFALSTIKTTYDIRKITLPYGTEFKIFDNRKSFGKGCEFARNEDKQNYNTRSLDIYMPYQKGQALKNRKVIFFVHGGGWTEGYKDWYSYVAKSFTGQKGWITVVIDYRLASKEVLTKDKVKAAYFPDNINDVADAFSFVNKNIIKYGGNPNQIFVMGHSAGANLATLFVVTAGQERFSKSIKGLISIAGAYSMPDLAKTSAKEDCLNETFLNPQPDNPQLKQASPISYIRKGLNLPPILLLYGEKEIYNLDLQAKDFSKALTDNKIKHSIYFLKDYTHDREVSDLYDINAEVTKQIVHFIEQH